METRVQKWGNSIGVRIPKQFAQLLHLSPGSPINLEIENGRLVINTPQYNLETMLESITPENRHPLYLDDDGSKGAEEW